jgi:hypothetical protein
VRQRGKETYKLKLTNKNYKESGKRIVGPVSAQALVEWLLNPSSEADSWAATYRIPNI